VLAADYFVQLLIRINHPSRHTASVTNTT